MERTGTCFFRDFFFVNGAFPHGGIDAAPLDADAIALTVGILRTGEAYRGPETGAKKGDDTHWVSPVPASGLPINGFTSRQV